MQTRTRTARSTHMHTQSGKDHDQRDDGAQHEATCVQTRSTRRRGARGDSTAAKHSQASVTAKHGEASATGRRCVDCFWNGANVFVASFLLTLQTISRFHLRETAISGVLLGVLFFYFSLRNRHYAPSTPRRARSSGASAASASGYSAEAAFASAKLSPRLRLGSSFATAHAASTRR